MQLQNNFNQEDCYWYSCITAAVKAGVHILKYTQENPGFRVLYMGFFFTPHIIPET